MCEPHPKRGGLHILTNHAEDVPYICMVSVNQKKQAKHHDMDWSVHTRTIMYVLKANRKCI